MLNGLYGYFFGGENTQETEQQENRENEAPKVGKELMEDDDWQLVPSQEFPSGRSSPVIVPQPELRDIDTLSLQSNKNATSTKVLRRAEEMRQVRAQVAQRIALETALFAEAAASLQLNGKTKVATGTNNQMTTSCLKRASAAAQSDSKGKQRSKKAGKLNSGRNNDRKCNNLN